MSKKYSHYIQDYIQEIQKKCSTIYNTHYCPVKKTNVKNKKKIPSSPHYKNNVMFSFNDATTDKTSEPQTIPTIQHYQVMLKNKYKLGELKGFCKHYKLNISGTKPQLTNKLFSFLYLSHHVIKIQSIVRKKIVGNYMKLHGPAYKNRACCTNSNDFISMEPLDEIYIHQFISYKDKDGFIYGFDICSLYHLSKNHEEIKNPYNRSIIPREVIHNMNRMLFIGYKILNTEVNLQFEDVSTYVSPEKMVELRALKLFQEIDNLGNYSNMNWFLSLSRKDLVQFIHELKEIWHYRADMTTQTKRNICPDTRGPFRNLNMQYMITEQNSWNVKKVVLEVMEQFVFTGIDIDHKTLGAYYILGTLTLVSLPAAISMPWLYNSFC